MEHDRQRPRAVLTFLCAALCLAWFAACGAEPPAPPNDTPPAAVESVGLQPFRGDGFVLLHPTGARLEDDAERNGARSSFRILGPQLSVRPADADWRWTGAAYELQIRTYANPERWTAEEWARAMLIDGRDGVHDHGAAVLGGHPAYRIQTFGGDSHWVTTVVTDTARVVTLTYNDAPVENNPLAEVARQVHALLLGTFRLTN